MLKIIKASAGSGKTYTLALEYITLLLGGERQRKWNLPACRCGWTGISPPHTCRDIYQQGHRGDERTHHQGTCRVGRLP